MNARFEALIAHQGPMVHADHSFRLPRRRSAPTSVIDEGKGSFWNWGSDKKPDLPDAVWLTVIGKQGPENETEAQRQAREDHNANARLFGKRDAYALPKSGPRYGKEGPKYATPKERQRLVDEILSKASKRGIVAELTAFAEYLRWMQSRAYDHDDPLDKAERDSWEALEALFRAMAESIAADRRFNEAERALNKANDFDEIRTAESKELKARHDRANGELKSRVERPDYASASEAIARSKQAEASARRDLEKAITITQKEQKRLAELQKAIDEQRATVQRLQGQRDAAIALRLISDTSRKTAEKDFNAATGNKRVYNSTLEVRKASFLEEIGIKQAQKNFDAQNKPERDPA